MTKEKLAIKLAIDIMERNINKYINHGIYEVSDTDGAVHVEFGEAINILNGMLEQEPCDACCGGNQEEKAKLCQKSYLMGMKHKAEQQPCTDAISRKALMNHIENQSREWGEDYDTEQILGDIEDFPSVTPIRPKGE